MTESAGNTLILPDSRLEQSPDKGCFMADWEMPDGSTVRIEVQPVFCANCGKLYGHVPKDNTSFVCYLCRKCHETYGTIAGTYVVPDQVFAERVQYEMQQAYGHSLTSEEVALLKSKDTLSRELQLLEKESPYPVPSH